MELDNLKPARQSMDRELQAQKRITSALRAHQAGSRVEASLKSLLNWQVVQIIRERLERMVSGASIDKAKRLLADIEQFEQHATQ